MLVKFTFSNFKCFKEENALNFVASNVKKNSFYSHNTAFKYSVLKTLAVFGANASGKTKLFEALSFMQCVICPPKRDNKIPVFDYWQTKYDSFRLSTSSKNAESSFEIVLILDDVQYRYGFEIDKTQILSEWLYLKKKRETPVFQRDKDNDFSVNSNYISEKIFESLKSANMVSSAVPLLAILATFNDALSKELVNWFNSIVVISANDMKPILALSETEKKNSIVSFLKAFDVNIEDISLHEMPTDNIPDKIKAIIGEEALKGKIFDGIRTTHKVYNELYERVDATQFSLEIDESFGTNRLLCLSWPIINSLRQGTSLFIDEFDSGIHTNIINIIVMLYYLCHTDAQLVINTQNPSLLSARTKDGNRLFRKDQIYLVNKNRYGESSVLPASSFKDDLRSNLEKMYLNGEISGVPYVDLDSLLKIIGGEIDG